jgi:pimeloyl-ACP methyl ester carboxylesterase
MTHRQVPVNGIELHLAECGDGPLVLLCHGFPELWYSWRHQLPVLAAAGYRAVALDQRGYGGSSRPEPVEDYDIVHLTGDLVGLLDTLGEERAVVVGHDWGAIVTWHLARTAPERLRGVAAMSVPLWPRPPKPPTVWMRDLFGDRFFYILHFQAPGVPDAQLASDPTAFLRLFLNRASADVFDGNAEVPPLPDWISEAEFAVYEAAFRRTGFTGGLNWYRNIDRNWELTAESDGNQIDVPTMFLAGERDPVLSFLPVGPMQAQVSDLRELLLLPGGGHWIQQERPAETNEALLRFLAGLGEGD